MRNTTLCYIERDGCYLMLHRVKKQKDVNHDKWVGIGGKFEDGETPGECVIREALEETNLTLIAPEYRGLVTFVSDQWETEYMHLFLAKTFTGTPFHSDDCNEGRLEWVPIEEVPNLPCWAGDRIFLRLLREKLPFFSLKLRYEGETLVEAKLNEEALALHSSAPQSFCPFRTDWRKNNERTVQKNGGRSGL